MDLRLTVDLPRDLDRMHTLRHALDGALSGLDVAEQTRADLGLIVSETWTNVIAHLRVGATFQVVTSISPADCVIEVTSPEGTSAPLVPLEHSLQVVSQLADSVDVGGDGLLLRVTKKL